MPKDKWAVHLCSCNNALPVSGKEIARLAELGAEPTVHRNLRWAADHLFDGGAAADADFHLVCCCQSREIFEDAIEKGVVEEDRLLHLDLKGDAFWRAGDDAAAGNSLAARLIRGAIARTEADRPPPSITLPVSSSVLIYTDRPEGLELARRLAERMDVGVVLDEAAGGFDELLPGQGFRSLSRGRVSRIEGHLGNFRAVFESGQAISLDTCTRCNLCVPVCHTQAITPGLRLIAEKCDECGDCLKVCGDVAAIQIPRKETQTFSAAQVVTLLAEAAAPVSGLHTGCHVVDAGAPFDVEAIAYRVTSLVGTFTRPSYVGYNEKICAGGTAEIDGCGICVEECPYDALSKEKSRIRLDEAACEGCGGCVSACPTSALSFRAPSAEQISAQLKALLSPLAGEGAPAVVFHCGEKGVEALRLAGENRWPLGKNLLPVEVPCLRYVSEGLMLHAFELGASGVALFGCADCPNGERPLVEARLAFCREVLDGFGLGAERLGRVSVESAPGAYYSASAIGDLGAFLEKLTPLSRPPSAPESEKSAVPPQPGNRQLVVGAVQYFLASSEKAPGRIGAGGALPFAEVQVAKGCTLCGACVFVCPTHALKMNEPDPGGDEAKVLQFQHSDCVACGMCEISCPEDVVKLERGLLIQSASFTHQELVRDEMVKCISCGTEFINKSALDAILGKLLGLAELGDTFDGKRKELLRMCPNCRGAHAVQEVERGWEP